MVALHREVVVSTPKKKSHYELRPKCQHCHKRFATKPRGLCRPCYYEPEVRVRYRCRQVKSKQRISSGNSCRSQPGQYLPGTVQKLELMASRFERGEPLFQRGDLVGE
jgi:hypothetical protein